MLKTVILSWQISFSERVMLLTVWRFYETETTGYINRQLLSFAMVMQSILADQDLIWKKSGKARCSSSWYETIIPNIIICKQTTVGRISDSKCCRNDVNRHQRTVVKAVKVQQNGIDTSRVLLLFLLDNAEINDGFLSNSVSAAFYQLLSRF